MQRTATIQPPEERGVYRSWWKRGGYHCLYAVTSTGERLDKLIPLREGISEERARRWFEALLDRVDPIRTISLVPPGGPKRITVAELDELYREADPVAARLYQRKRERLRGAGGPPLYRDRLRLVDGPTSHPSE